MPAVTVARTPEAPMASSGHERRVAGEERDRDAHLGVCRTLADLGDDPPDRDSDRHAAGGPKDELQAGVGEREAPGHDGGDRNAVGH
jgi:hypothetical protein